MLKVNKLVQQTHLDLEIASSDELVPEPIAARLLASGGAHKPNAFDFGGGRLLEKEWY